MLYYQHWYSFDAAYLVEVNDSVSQTFRRKGCLTSVTRCWCGEGASWLDILCVVIDSFCHRFGWDCSLSRLQSSKVKKNNPKKLFIKEINRYSIQTREPVWLLLTLFYTLLELNNQQLCREVILYLANTHEGPFLIRLYLNISMHLLHTDLYLFPLVLTWRIWLRMGSFSSW